MQLVSVTVPPLLYRPPPLPVVVAAGDRQSRDRRRDTRVDLEHPAQPAAADRHARRRARDRLRPGRVAQLELGAAQGDRLRRLEHRLVKGDRLGPPVVFAWAIAWRRSIWPMTGVSVGLFTMNVDSSLRSSSASNVGRIRRRFRASTVPRPLLR